MSNEVIDAVIGQQLKQLRLPGVGRAYEQVGCQAREENWSYEEYLRELLDTELRSRHDRAAERRLREARFPDVKTLDQIDWDVLSGVSRPKVLELASCEFVEKAEDVVIAGPVGTGKTHLATALGVGSDASTVPCDVHPCGGHGSRSARGTGRPLLRTITPKTLTSVVVDHRRAGVRPVCACRR